MDSCAETWRSKGLARSLDTICESLGSSYAWCLLILLVSIEHRITDRTREIILLVSLTPNTKVSVGRIRGQVRESGVMENEAEGRRGLTIWVDWERTRAVRGGS